MGAMAIDGYVADLIDNEQPGLAIKLQPFFDTVFNRQKAVTFIFNNLLTKLDIDIRILQCYP